jgi:hypothetical protein
MVNDVHTISCLLDINIMSETIGSKPRQIYTLSFTVF